MQYSYRTDCARLSTHHDESVTVIMITRLVSHAADPGTIKLLRVFPPVLLKSEGKMVLGMSIYVFFGVLIH